MGFCRGSAPLPGGLGKRRASPTIGKIRLLHREQHTRPAPPLGQSESQPGPQTAESIGQAATEVDRGGLGKIFCRAGNLGNREPMPVDLRQHLVVEDEIVGILRDIQLLQDLPRKRPVAGVVFGEMGPDEQVLRPGEEPVGRVFPPGHAALQRQASQDAAAQDAGV